MEGITIFDLSLFQWVVVILCAVFIGFSKTGLPSLGILVVTILMFVFPPKASVGILLPMMIIGDIFAVSYYRRHVIWKHLVSLIPWVLGGIISGYFILKIISGDQLKPMIGVIVVGMTILHVVQKKMGSKLDRHLPQSTFFTGFMGVLGGFTTMVGNAAGGVMDIYLLVKKLPKQNFVGTGAWFFLFVNLLKVPFYLYLGLINTASITFNLWMVPAIIIGAFIGVKVLALIPQKLFQILVLFLAAIGGVRLLF
jgi:uncharacterized membrane protein YfcA